LIVAGKRACENNGEVAQVLIVMQEQALEADIGQHTRVIVPFSAA
jgi:hypothetical protein